MTTNFFIPKKINVGFQNRSSTYTGKLAYIIYFDEKGKLRKEASWSSWRDEKIENIIYDNEPSAGFVLNKKVGGYDSGWNHRQTYVRVYDPRGFEFEITVPNLLYILENATSTKGKGLEGEFVYGWDGKDLVLIPVEAPDYKELVRLNEIRHSDKKIGARDLILGATYRTKQNEEWIYMGKFKEYDYWDEEKVAKPKFWFYDTNNKYGSGFKTIASVPQKIIETIVEEPAASYADLFDELEGEPRYSPVDESKTVFEPYSYEEFAGLITSKDYGHERVWGAHQVHKDLMLSHSVGGYQRERDGLEYELFKSKEQKARNYYSEKKDWIPTIEKTTNVREIFDAIKPYKKLIYLENGRFHREAKY